MRYLKLPLLGLLLAAAPLLEAQGKIPTTKEVYGFTIGDDYRLANYTQFTDYMKKLDAASDRMTLQSIGKTAEGRDQWMGIITSPANHRLLSKYKDISQRLARAEGLTEAQARTLSKEGKAVVWIDGGLHATEVLGAAQLAETVYQLVSRNDEETLRFLNDLIILAVHANPDGMELVSNWYMKESDEKKRNSSDIPRLYQKYIGHDNNRDFYALTQAESRNMARQLSIEWIPQIMYNHHQTGPTGAVLFAPPFRDPFNYNFDPLVLTGLDLECSDVIARAYAGRGMGLHLGAHLTRVALHEGRKRVEFTSGDHSHEVNADEILLAMGRQPATRGLGLDNAGVTTQRAKVVVNERMQTSQPHIFAAGDVCSPLDVVHIAIQQGEVAARNAARLINGQEAGEAIDYRLTLFGVFSHPQVAVVGATAGKLKARGIPFIEAAYPFNDHGKSLVMGETEGFVKMIAHAGTGEILGACVVGPEATELIHEVVVAMSFHATAGQFMTIPHYHPTLSEIWTYPAEEIAEQL